MGPPDIERPDRAQRRPHLPGPGAAEPDVGPPARGRAPPLDGLYLCGAATHPGGSVIALNGRIAAGEVLGAAVPA